MDDGVGLTVGVGVASGLTSSAPPGPAPCSGAGAPGGAGGRGGAAGGSSGAGGGGGGGGGGGRTVTAGNVNNSGGAPWAAAKAASAFTASWRAAATNGLVRLKGNGASAATASGSARSTS